MSKKYRLLMMTTLIISGCSMCYELIISAVSSYLLGNSTLQYSVTIGLYMSALGLGSYLSRFFTKRLFHSLILIELGIGLLGGLSSLLLFYANLYISSYETVMYLEIILIGALAGAEIPLLTRIIEEDENNLKVTLSSIFSFDYIGGLLGAIFFPLVLLPVLGFFSTSFLCGLLNISAALLILLKYGERIEHVKFYRLLAVGMAGGMVFGMVYAENISDKVEGGLYRDTIIFREQTKYQKIVVTKHRDDTRLYIDGNCQFSTADEYRYHEALVHLPMSKVKTKNHVLVLGGGDGLAVRELLKYDIRRIDLVDLDAEMIRICSTNPNITAVNRDSLKSEKLKIYTQDAYEYLEECKEEYDLIIVDLPDPNSEVLNKLYSNVFYRMCRERLAKGGVLVSQSTSPYYAPKAFWCIHRTMESAGLHVKPYHVEVPSFGDWGFNMASVEEMDGRFSVEVETKFLSDERIPSMFSFGKDEVADEVEINRLTRPRLMTYYNEAVKNWE